ncbi:MAG: PadR family transcriptional regulator [Gemmatimonadota bacterium]|jgi:DNA-binding PadR family transcriptional regulator
MSDPRDPTSFTPLRPVEFEILLVLTGGESHGYGMIKEVEERSGGTNRIATGTLYRALRRLSSTGLVAPTGRRSNGDSDEERRRYYAITPLGRRVAAAEARRMADQVATARARSLLPGFDEAGIEKEGGVG